MNTLRHTPLVYAFNRNIASVSVACIILALFCIRAGVSQDEESPASDLEASGQLDVININEAAREQELQRKEEELLRALGAQPEMSSETSAVTTSTQSAPVQIGKVEVATGAESGAGDSFNQVVVREQPASNALRALEHHPALDARQASTANQSPPSNTIRTYVPDDGYDGTTAARVGTFHRVDRSQPRDNRPQRETASTHTISLREIEEEASLRHASLTFNEVATIRNASTRLKTGPARSDANLTALPQYSEVSIDYRSGAWYRVRTAAGQRGWVHGSSLLFDAGISPHSAVRVGAVNSNIR